jgi:5-methylcytosine-specific restriction endonuclease McrA
MIDNKRRRAEFARIRKQRLIELVNRDGGTHCHYCHRPFNDLDWPIPSRRVVDHIVPVVLGGNDELSNLVLACVSCNSLKKDMGYTDFLRRIESLKELEFVGRDYRQWAEEYMQRQQQALGDKSDD